MTMRSGLLRLARGSPERFSRFCAGFLNGRFAPGSDPRKRPAGAVSGRTVSLGLAQRFRGRLSEPLMHIGYLITALGCRTVSFRGPLASFPRSVLGLLGAVGGSLNIVGSGSTPRRQFGASGSEFGGSSGGASGGVLVG